MQENHFYSTPSAKDEKGPEKVSAEQLPKEKPDYDKGYKSTLSIREELLHFLIKYIHAVWVRMLTPEDIRPYPNELILPDYESRIPDLVFEIRLGGEWLCCYLLIQMQSSVDFTMIFRFLTEMQGILMKSFLSCGKNERERKEYRIPAAVPILLYNGKNNWTAEKNFRSYQRNGALYEKYSLDFEYYLVNISSLDDQLILNSNLLIDNIIYLDKHRYDRTNLPEKLSMILTRVKEMEPEKQAMFWEWIEHVFMVSVAPEYRKQIIKLTETAKGGAIMFKYAITDTIETWMREAEEKGHSLGMAEGRSLGMAEGRSLGMTEGYSHGIIAESIDIIIRKLDQGLSVESISYWLEKDMDFVSAVAQLHKSKPDATAEMLAKLYCADKKEFASTLQE